MEKFIYQNSTSDSRIGDDMNILLRFPLYQRIILQKMIQFFYSISFLDNFIMKDIKKEIEHLLKLQKK